MMVVACVCEKGLFFFFFFFVVVMVVEGRGVGVRFYAQWSK